MACLWTEPAIAATVKNKLPKRSVVVIDEGSNSGVSKGDQVCFYNKKDTEVGCGSVNRVQAKRSFVKVPKNILKKIRKGFIASYGDDASSSGSRPGGSSKSKSKSQKDMVRLRPLGGWTILQAYSANFPDYARSKAPYWDTKEDSIKEHTLVALGTDVFAGIEIEVPIAFSTIGFRYNLKTAGFTDGTTDFIADGSLAECKEIPGTPKPYKPCAVNTNFASKSMGFWLQFMYDFPITSSITFALGLGADMDMSTLTFDIDQVIEEPESRKITKNAVLIKDAQSKLMSWGVRVVPVHVNIDFMDGFGFFASAAAIIGVYGNSTITNAKTQSNLDTDDPNVKAGENASADQKKYVSEYFKDAINHGPGIGAMLQAGLQAAF